MLISRKKCPTKLRCLMGSGVRHVLAFATLVADPISADPIVLIQYLKLTHYPFELIFQRKFLNGVRSKPLYVLNIAHACMFIVS